MIREYKLGDVIRCKRCRHTFEIVRCDDEQCGRLHGIAMIDQYGAAQLVADRTAEFCSGCVHPEEIEAMARYTTAHRAGQGGN